MNEKPALTKSFILHLIIFSVFFFFRFISTSFSTPMEIPEAIHVDLVGLPDLVKSENNVNDFSSPVKEETKQEKKSVVEEKADVKVPVKEDKLKDALDAINKFKKDVKKLEKKNQEEEEKVEEAAQKTTKSKALLEEMQKEAASRKAIKGNMVSTGNSTSGEVIENAVQAWGLTIVNEVKKYWDLPPDLVDSDLKGVAVVLIGDDGRKLNYYISKSSGNPVFDAHMERALSQVEMVPPPPENLKDQARKDGVILHFPLK